MKFLTASSLVISTFVLGLSQTTVSAFTLDAFSDSNESLQNLQVFPPSTSGSDPDTFLSGTDFDNRTIELTLDNNVSGGNILINPSATAAYISSNAGTTINSAKFTWDFDVNTIPGYANLKDDPTHDSLQIELLSIDQVGGANFKFTLTDSSSDVVMLDQDISSIGTQDFLYADFESQGNINLNEITKVNLEITNAMQDFDASFDFIQSGKQVPFEFSPTLGIVIGGSFIGFNVLKKRSKKK